MLNQEIRNKIIKEVYVYNEDHIFTGGYCSMNDYVKDHHDMAVFLLYHPNFVRLLWSKYNGLRYHPERFDNLVLT